MVGADSRFSATVIAAAESIVIEQGVMCGANVTISDTDWHGLYPSDRRGPGTSNPSTSSGMSGSG